MDNKELEKIFLRKWNWNFDHFLRLGLCDTSDEIKKLAKHIAKIMVEDVFFEIQMLKYTERCLSPNEITMLGILEKFDSPKSIEDLAEKNFVSKKEIKEVIKKLADRKLVEVEEGVVRLKSN